MPDLEVLPQGRFPQDISRFRQRIHPPPREIATGGASIAGFSGISLKTSVGPHKALRHWDLLAKRGRGVALNEFGDGQGTVVAFKAGLRISVGSVAFCTSS